MSYKVCNLNNGKNIYLTDKAAEMLLSKEILNSLCCNRNLDDEKYDHK